MRIGSGVAQPLITYSGWDAATRTVQVGAYVAGLDAGNASCVLTLSMAGVSRSVSAVAVPSSSTMQCGSLSVAGSQLTPGTWSAVVRYASPQRSGTSAVASIVVAS